MTSRRLTVSVLLAILVHAAVLLLVQLFLRLAPDRLPDYSGPLIVTLEQVPETPVLERVEERQAQPRPQPRAEPAARTQPEAQAAPQVVPKTAPAQPRTATAPVQPQPRTAPAPQPAPGQAAAQPQRQPQGTRQVVPAEPLGTLPPVAPEEATPYTPQTFSQPLADQGPIRAAAEEPEQAPRLDTSSLDSAIAQPDTGASAGAPAARSGVSSGAPGAAPTAVEGFQIEWQNPSQGRQVMQSAQPQIPAWVSEEGLRLRVVVSFVLQPSGYLRDIRIAASSGYSDVDTAVVSALRRWRFSSSPGAPDVRGEVTYRIIAR